MQYCLIEVFSFSLSMKKFTKGFLSLIIWEMSNTHEVSLLHKDTFERRANLYEKTFARIEFLFTIITTLNPFYWSVMFFVSLLINDD